LDDPTFVNDNVLENRNYAFVNTANKQMISNVLDPDSITQVESIDAIPLQLEQIYLYDAPSDVITSKFNKWHGDTEKFIVHWFKQVCLYESTVQKKAHLTNDQKMMLLITACKENCELWNIDNVFKALLALDPIQLPCSLEQYNALLLNAACLSVHSGDKSPSVTSVRAVPIDGEQVWQCIKSEDDTLQEVSMFANELFLDVTRLSAIILQESGERVKAQVILQDYGERVKAQVIDLVDEDLPDPERDKVHSSSLSSAECMILITQSLRK
jgi:hypothetical protein